MEGALQRVDIWQCVVQGPRLFRRKRGALEGQFAVLAPSPLGVDTADLKDAKALLDKLV